MAWWFFNKKEDHNKKIKDLHKSLERSFYHIKSDMKNVNEWIEHFKEKHNNNKENFSELFKRIGLIEHEIEQLNAKIENDDINFIDKESERSHAIERVQSFNRSNQSFMNVQSMHSVGSLTPAQKQVLALLVIAKRPLDYNDIASELKLNVVTIRRHVNDLKRCGVYIKEKVSVKNRRKLIYLDKKIKEKVIEISSKNQKSKKKL